MLPRVMVRSASRHAAAPEEGNGLTSVEVNEGVDRVPDSSTIIAQQLQNLLPTILAYVGNQGSNQGDNRNQSSTAINDNIQGNVRNVMRNNGREVCSYKEFLACNPKEYDAVSMAWDDFKVLIIDELYPSNEMQKLEIELWNHAMVGAGHATYNDRFHELPRLVPYLVTLKSKRIERYVYGLARGIVATTKPKTIQKKGNGGEPSKDRNVRDDNKRTRTGNDFATTTNPVRREYTGLEARGKSSEPSSGCQWGSGSRNQGNKARERAFMLGIEENCQEPNIMTGIEPSDLGSSYEIKITSGQLVEIDKVIKGCKLEIDGHVFGDTLWKIPLLDSKVLRVLREKTRENVRQLMSDMAKEKKQEEIMVVRYFLEIVLEQLKVFNHVIQLFQNPSQCAINELVHLSLPHHFLLIIPISVDYDSWLENNGVIIFKEKVRGIPFRFSEVELCLIALSVELQVFHTNGRACLEDEADTGVAVSGYCLETDDTENPYVRSDCTTISEGTASIDVEFFALKPPMRNTMGYTNFVFSFTS
nr:reverse transcriptase domain-containing protein [Tanacetum cinerariifolium]